MLIAVIPFYDILNALDLVKNNESLVDGFEIRWDYATEIHLLDIQKIRESSRLPMIFTLRRYDQGGHYLLDESSRFGNLMKLCEGNPDYLDLEWDVPKKWITRIRQLFPKIKIIGSYHNFKNFIFEIPNDDFDIIKIAVYCNSSLDALKLLQMQMKATKPSIFLGMGRAAKFIRALGPIVGRVFDYASISENKKVVEGQLSVDELLSIYRYRHLNEHTRIYGLIGNPIESSLGHVFHNNAFDERGANAVYVKIPVKLTELQSFFTLIQTMPIDGLSVTMPLKKEVCSIAKVLYLKNDPLNTLKRINGQWHGTNTDGDGALQAIGDKLTNTIILGAGGAACAIAQAITQQGFKVVAYNRTLYKNLGFAVIDALPIHDEYGLIINTLPDMVYRDNPLLLQKIIDWIKPGMTVMDINYPQQGIFLETLQQLGVNIILGIDMFYAQAQLQLKFWGF